MVSMPYLMPYPQKPGTNLAYPAQAWYSNYPSHHGPHHANNQFLNAAPPSIGATNGLLDSDSAASFYNAHHHMLHQSSPEWVHDNYNLSTPNSQFFPNGMTPPTSVHSSPTINSQHSSNANTSGDNLNGLQNVPPSPPTTVISACSEVSSPGIASNANNGLGNDDVSPNVSSNSLSRPKSPYEWMKKPSYQSAPSSGIDQCTSSQLDDYVSSMESNGKTRTKDKYRVVYTDYQRLELEKEYHMSHYITIRRKSELAQSLQLSERQVKIWLQNRRAKDRKQTKKRDGPINNGIMSNSCGNVGLSLAHHQMGNNPLTSAMYGLDIKPKLEPGLLGGHHAHNYGHLHQPHAPHPMHHLSMGMNLLHQSHMHHSAASILPPAIPSPSPSVPQAHLSS